MPVAIPSTKLTNPIPKASIEANQLKVRVNEFKLEKCWNTVRVANFLPHLFISHWLAELTVELQVVTW